MYSNLVSEGGHLEADKIYDTVRYLPGRNIGFVLSAPFHIPRAKKKESGKGIKLIKEISEKEYLLGKKREKKDPYLNPLKRRLPRSHGYDEQGGRIS